MMHKVISRFKYPGCWALCLSFIAVTAVEFSYVLGGLNWLDALIFLLIPAFILLIIQLVLTFNTETRSYCMAFTILIACLVFSLFCLSNIEFGTVGDQYHLMKIVASSIKNDFSTQFQIFTGPSPGKAVFISDFVESIWGIFWRWTQWDFNIILLQALPIVLLWQQLVRFFQKQGIAAFAGPLATVVVMSLEILWCQQSSPYIDSTVGIFIGITLLLSYSFLTPPYERRFSYLAGLIFVAGLCLISKPTGFCVAFLGMSIAIILGCRHLNTLQKICLPLIALPSLIYFISHQIQIMVRTGNLFYPYVDNTNTFQFFDSYPQYYRPLRFYSWIHDHAFNFKPLYVLSSWISDFRLDSYITPAPYIRGNGLVFSYFVIPTLILWIFNHIKNGDVYHLKNGRRHHFLWADPRLSILGVIVIYYYFFPGSIDVRFALGYNIFILSWCFSYLWQYMGQRLLNRFKPLPVILICIMLLMSTGSYFDGIRGWKFERKIISPLLIQKKIFPQEYTADIRDSIIQRLYQEHSGQ